MSLRYLLGPVSAHQSWRCWHQPRQQGLCRAFNAIGDLDVRIAYEDRWEDVLRRLPEGWQPDFLLLELSGTAIPPALWRAPLPLVGLAADWDMQWHAYRHLLPLCDLVLTDSLGTEWMHRAGFRHVRSIPLSGVNPHLLEWPPAEEERPFDIVFAGTIDRLRRPTRSAWLGRIAHLSSRWRVAIRTGLPEHDYQTLLRQARIVFNHSRYGECNR